MLVPPLVPISLSVPVQIINPLVPAAILVLAIIVVKSEKKIAQTETSCEEIAQKQYFKMCLKIA